MPCLWRRPWQLLLCHLSLAHLAPGLPFWGSIAGSLCWQLWELPELGITILGIGALGHLSLHSFACPLTHLGRCCFWKRTVGNVVHEQSSLSAKKQDWKEALGSFGFSYRSWKVLENVGQFHFKASFFVLVPPVRCHFRTVWKNKKPFKYWSLICCINLIYDDEFTNLGHSQVFFFPLLHLRVLGWVLYHHGLHFFQMHNPEGLDL